MKLSLTRLAGAAVVLLLVATPGCRGDDDLLIGFDCGQEVCDDPPRFTPTPDGGPVTSPEAGAFVGMCPSNECPAGRMTCPNDPFPCGVDLTSDDDNCGACGVRCPHDKPSSRASRGDALHGRRLPPRLRRRIACRLQRNRG